MSCIWSEERERCIEGMRRVAKIGAKQSFNDEERAERKQRR
jgi:hypothetical protein